MEEVCSPPTVTVAVTVICSVDCIISTVRVASTSVTLCEVYSPRPEGVSEAGLVLFVHKGSVVP